MIWEVLVLALLFLLLAMDGGWKLQRVLNLLLSAMPFYIIPFAIVLPRRVMKNHQQYLTSKWHWVCDLVFRCVEACGTHLPVRYIGGGDIRSDRAYAESKEGECKIKADNRSCLPCVE